MARYLVVGDPVITLSGEDYIRDGAVIVEGSSIVTVGPRDRLEQAGPFERVLGSPQHFLMPGFINCHYHSELPIGPGLYQYVFERANVHMQGTVGDIAEEDLYLNILWGLINTIKGGQTAAIDMYYGRPGLPLFGCEPALRAYEDIGFRVAFGLVSRDENIYVHEENEKFLSRLPGDLAEEIRRSPMGYAWPVGEVMAAYDTLAKRWDGRHDRIRIILAPDWTPACSDDLYRLCRRMASEYNTGLTTHVLETRSEMLYNLKRYGKPALRRLQDIGVLGPDVSCAHFVWVTDEELKIFAESGAIASNNPGSNLRLSTGICRVRDIMDSGGRIAFGTDGISFSDKDDFFQEVRLACYLQRLPRALEVGRLDSSRVLRAAGENGARGVRFEGKLGKIEPGCYADLLLVKKDRIFYPPGRYDDTPVLDVILDRTEAADIESVLIHGKIVMDNGRITTVDEDRVRAALAEAVQQRVYRFSDEVRRWGELGRLVEPYVIDFYRSWYQVPLEPAYIYNVRTPPKVSP